MRAAIFLLLVLLLPVRGEGEATLRDELSPVLVTLSGGELKPCDPSALANTKRFVFYFASGWSAACERVTTQLVGAYPRLKQSIPDFELILVSSDRSAEEMLQTITKHGITWPVVDFGRLGDLPSVNRFSGRGIPAMVLLDETGKVLSDSFQGKQYLGPGKVISDLESMAADEAKKAKAKGTTTDWDAVFKKKTPTR